LSSFGDKVEHRDARLKI